MSSLRRPGEERFDWFSRNQDRVVVKPIQIKMSNSRRSRKKDEPPADGEIDLFSLVSKLKKARAEAKLAQVARVNAICLANEEKIHQDVE